jgi:hypothetical protein
MDVETARALLRGMGDEDGIALQCPGRVALHVRLLAPGPVVALATALTRWRTTARTVGPTGWQVVRAEVLTDDEFKRDLQAGQP